MSDEDDRLEEEEEEDDLSDMPEWLREELTGPPAPPRPLSAFLPPEVLEKLSPALREQIEARQRQDLEKRRQEWEEQEHRRRQEAADERMLRRYAPHADELINALEFGEGEPDWEWLEARCPVPAMPLREWEAICSAVRHEWETGLPSEESMAEYAAATVEEYRADGEELDFGAELQEVRYTAEEARRDACATVLRRRITSFVNRYLLPPPDITGKQAEALPPRQWEAVALVCNRRLTLADAAEVMGVDPGTVKQHFNLAAKTLGLSAAELRRRRLGD